MAEALGKHLAGDKYEFFSAGTETRPKINQDAVRLMKELYDIDMSGYYSKTIDEIPDVDIAVSMGCGVVCPYFGRDFDYDLGLIDPTGESDEVFVSVIKEIEAFILNL